MAGLKLEAFFERIGMALIASSNFFSFSSYGLFIIISAII
jgi:hypothetical protein